MPLAIMLPMMLRPLRMYGTVGPSVLHTHQTVKSETFIFDLSKPDSHLSSSTLFFSFSIRKGYLIYGFRLGFAE